MVFKSYDDFAELRHWLTEHMPDAAKSLYHPYLYENEWLSARREYARAMKSSFQMVVDKIGKFDTIEEGAMRFKRRYETSDYGVSLARAVKSLAFIMDQAKRPLSDFEDEYDIAVMPVTPRVARALKWRCPLPCVRAWLRDKYGVGAGMERVYALWMRLFPIRGNKTGNVK